MFDNSTKQSVNGLNTDETFILEFLAYNVSASDITKKIYVKVPSGVQKENSKKIALRRDQLHLISQALDNRYLSSFQSDRYTLFDISFRELGSTSKIGFSFNDVKDYTFIEPIQVFKSFKDYGIKEFINTLDALQNSMFPQKPEYNPIFMMGIVIDTTKLKSIKAYIRYDLEEAPTPFERKNMMESVIRAINPKRTRETSFFNNAGKVEDLGFVFSFVGVDYCADGAKRYKLYFRSYEENDLGAITNEVALMSSQFGQNDSVRNIFSKHKNGMWGIALSTDSFEYVNGVQLYFYP